MHLDSIVRYSNVSPDYVNHICRYGSSLSPPYLMHSVHMVHDGVHYILAATFWDDRVAKMILRSLLTVEDRCPNETRAGSNLTVAILQRPLKDLE